MRGHNYNESGAILPAYNREALEREIRMTQEEFEKRLTVSLDNDEFDSDEIRCDRQIWAELPNGHTSLAWGYRHFAHKRTSYVAGVAVVESEGKRIVETFGPYKLKAHPKDQWSRKGGRKIGFKRLLENVYPGYENRKIRRGAWNAFFLMEGGYCV